MVLALVYLRLSVDRTGEAESIERQEVWARREASQRGWDVAEVFTERDASASKPGTRPVFAALLERVQRGGIQHVLAWRSDRLWRHIQDQQAFMALAAVAGLRSVVTSDEGVVSVGSDDDEFRSSLNALLGGRESKVIARRVAFYEASRAAEGKPHSGGRRAFGYARDGIEVVPSEASAILDGYRRVIRGETLHSIARDWNERGLRTAGNGNLFRNRDLVNIFLAPRYAGLRAHHGEIVAPAVWPAIVDREAYEATCALLRARTLGPRVLPARRNLLAGMLACPCGARLTAQVHSARYPSYRCSLPGVGHVSIRSTDVESIALAALWDRLDAQAQEVAEAVTGAQRASQGPSRLGELAGTVDAARARLMELEAMYADGEVSRAEYARMRSRARLRLTEAEAELRSSQAAYPTELPSAATLRASWDRLTVDERRSILRTVFVRFDVLPRGSKPRVLPVPIG